MDRFGYFSAAWLKEKLIKTREKMSRKEKKQALHPFREFLNMLKTPLSLK
jgi:hypothetical protein